MSDHYYLPYVIVADILFCFWFIFVYNGLLFVMGIKFFFKLCLFTLSKSKVTTQVPVVPIFNMF